MISAYGLFYGNNELYGVSFDRKVLEQKKKDLEILYELAVAYLKDCNNTRFRLDENLRENLKGNKSLGEQSKIYSEYQQQISKLGKKEDKNLAWSNLVIKEVNIL